MSTISLRGYLGLACAACLVALAWGFTGLGQERGQRQPPAEGGKPETKLTRLYFGTRACRGCHEKVPEQETPPLVCECTEYTKWMKEDKHKIAYTVLEQPRAKRMGELLGKNVTQKETGCINCHGIVAPDQFKHETFSIQDGVSCVVCHGPYKEWVNQHQQALDRRNWQKLSRKDKLDKYGMTDLWDPALRTQMCVSCHIGNLAEGKFVTHEMYAAGHPPLPGMEIATFSNQMPRHWKYIKEKTEAVQEILKFKPGSQQFEQSKLVVVGSVVSLAETMRLLGAQAAQAANPKAGIEGGLDFANFDCYACHHDLKIPSWRQERGYFGKPGRPHMRPWPSALVKIVLQEIRNEEGSKDLEEGLTNLAKAFDAQPFGDPKQISSAATKLADSLTKLGQELAKEDTPLYQARVPRLLKRICTVNEKNLPDYDTARQLAWAFEILYQEWKPAEKDQDQKILATLKELKTELKLDLPAGLEKNITDFLPGALKTIGDYDPKKFKGHMDVLADRLEKSK